MWYRSCQKPYFQPQWDRSAPRALWHHQKQQKTCSTPWLCVGASQSCFARCLRPEHSVLACLSDTSFILPTGHSLGSTKVSRAQTFPSYPAEQGEEHQQSLSLASSYTFSYGSGLVQWQLGQPAKRDSQAWNLPPGPGSSVHPPHPQLPWNLRPTSSSPATMKMGIWRGSFPEAEAKSLFIYFAIPSVNMFRTEMVGAGGVGGGRASIRVVRKWLKQMKLCWCEGFCMTREGPVTGLCHDVHLTSESSYPSPSAGQPIFTGVMFRPLL